MKRILNMITCSFYGVLVAVGFYYILNFNATNYIQLWHWVGLIIGALNGINVTLLTYNAWMSIDIEKVKEKELTSLEEMEKIVEEYQWEK